MILLFDLSKEHPLIPKREIISLYQAYQIEYSIIYENESVLVLDSTITNDFLSILSTRLAFTHSISHYLFHASSIHEIKQIKNPPLETFQGSMAIRYKNRSKTQDSRKIVQSIASLFTSTKPVDLENPDHEIYAIITDKTIFVGQRLFILDRNDFEKRKVQFRPFFSPISLHPKLARGLVNIAQVVPMNKILDPFCGTGGFLIEAGLIGCNVYGSDIKDEMIVGTRKNITQYKLSPKQLFSSDIGSVSEKIQEKMDAVITDAPYGKSTTTKKEDIDDLYSRAFHSISNVLKPGGRVIIGLPNKSYESLFKNHFYLDEMIAIPVHRSLTRYFYSGVK